MEIQARKIGTLEPLFEERKRESKYFLKVINLDECWSNFNES